MEISQEIRQRIVDFSRELAGEFGEIPWDEFGSPFEAIEVRVAEIGDMLTREVTGEMSRKHLQIRLPDGEAACPDCGATGRQKGLRSRKLQTIRGEIEIREPEFHCHDCRRSFFPDSPLDRS